MINEEVRGEAAKAATSRDRISSQRPRADIRDRSWAVLDLARSARLGHINCAYLRRPTAPPSSEKRRTGVGGGAGWRFGTVDEWPVAAQRRDEAC